MSESSVKKTLGANFDQSIIFYKIANMNVDVEVSNTNENSINSEDSYHPRYMLQNSAYETVEVNGKCEIEVKEEPIQIQAVEIQFNKEIEIYEKPIAFKMESYHSKHDLTHAGKISYQCSFCSKSFSHTKQLYIHMSTHLIVAIQSLESHPPSVPVHTGIAIYECSPCDTVSKHRGHLNNHIRTHIGEKSYQCIKCDKAFSQNNHLKLHQRTHTGHKPYQC
ncbi:unnamed protein product, partial [Meganyctiphanes norvegica]